MNLETMFLTIFFAVLLALLTARWIDNISRSHRRWKAYCKAQAEEHNRLMNQSSDKGNQEMADVHAKYYNKWKKDAKSWWGLR